MFIQFCLWITSQQQNDSTKKLIFKKKEYSVQRLEEFYDKRQSITSKG